MVTIFRQLPDAEIMENICEDRDSAHLVGKANAGVELSSARLQGMRALMTFME
jgi:hypothetical protein